MTTHHIYEKKRYIWNFKHGYETETTSHVVLCQNELADDNNVLMFRSEHIHGHWLELKILNECVYVKSTPIGNMNSIHQPFLLFEHEEVKAMHSLPWLRVGWIVFYKTRETDRNLNISVKSSIPYDSFSNLLISCSVVFLSARERESREGVWELRSSFLPFFLIFFSLRLWVFSFRSWSKTLITRSRSPLLGAYNSHTELIYYGIFTGRSSFRLLFPYIGQSQQQQQKKGQSRSAQARIRKGKSVRFSS